MVSAFGVFASVVALYFVGRWLLDHYRGVRRESTLWCETDVDGATSWDRLKAQLPEVFDDDTS